MAACGLSVTRDRFIKIELCGVLGENGSSPFDPGHTLRCASAVWIRHRKLLVDESYSLDKRWLVPKRRLTKIQDVQISDETGTRLRRSASGVDFQTWVCSCSDLSRMRGQAGRWSAGSPSSCDEWALPAASSMVRYGTLIRAGPNHIHRPLR
eukprot:scaffold17187_cov43-Prasinocladus_malaysianus.AAC.1